MAIHLNEPNFNPIEQCYIPDRATVIFDWDNTLKVINVKKRCIESRVKVEFLEQLVRDKHCTLYIISAIQPSRINMSTILFEVDKLGLRKYFCSHCQNELNNCENQTCSSCPAVHDESFQISSTEFMINGGKSSVLLRNKTPSCCAESKQGELKKCIAWECSHKLDTQLVNSEYRYARWGNIVISGYDKAEVFLELTMQDNKRLKNFYSPTPITEELPAVIDLSAARCVTSRKNEVFHFECDCSAGEDSTEEADCCDDADNATVTLRKLERAVIFFDDEKVNIDNFKAIVKYSHCYLVV
ncbi:unnamed protein product [Lymnaea stagnalis]|uniref:Uncharacterized protein n=1 Tax=Lymnaea stagnalis TaxID=6523 RepID=A0AAV2I329_LYMST